MVSAFVYVIVIERMCIHRYHCIHSLSLLYAPPRLTCFTFEPSHTQLTCYHVNQKYKFRVVVFIIVHGQGTTNKDMDKNAVTNGWRLLEMARTSHFSRFCRETFENVVWLTDPPSHSIADKSCVQLGSFLTHVTWVLMTVTGPSGSVSNVCAYCLIGGWFPHRPSYSIDKDVN